MKKGLLRILILRMSLLGIPLYAAKDIAYTQDDLERFIRVEEATKGVNYRIDSLQKRMKNVENLIYVLISAIFSQIICVVGFVLLDRRTALATTISKNKELDEKTEKVEKAFKEIAKTNKILRLHYAKLEYYKIYS